MTLQLLHLRPEAFQDIDIAMLFALFSILPSLRAFYALYLAALSEGSRLSRYNQLANWCEVDRTPEPQGSTISKSHRW